MITKVFFFFLFKKLFDSIIFFLYIENEEVDYDDENNSFE